MKTIIFTVLIIITLITGGFFAYKIFNGSAQVQSPISDLTPPSKPSEVPIKEKTKEFTDPAGFKFAYPESLKVKANENPGSNYYSSLQMNHNTKNGKMTVDLTSTNYLSLDQWVKQNPEISGNSIDTELADLEAKKIASPGKLMVVAVDVETLISITADFPKAETAYWNDVLKTVADSFEFETPQSQPAANQPASAEDSIVFEGEEMIE